MFACFVFKHLTLISVAEFSFSMAVFVVYDVAFMMMERKSFSVTLGGEPARRHSFTLTIASSLKP